MLQGESLARCKPRDAQKNTLKKGQKSGDSLETQMAVLVLVSHVPSVACNTQGPYCAEPRTPTRAELGQYPIPSFLEASAHDVGLVDHPCEAALVDDEDAAERELREVKMDEAHRRARLHSEGRRVEPELEPGRVRHHLPKG